MGEKLEWGIRIRIFPSAENSFISKRTNPRLSDGGKHTGTRHPPNSHPPSVAHIAICAISSLGLTLMYLQSNLHFPFFFPFHFQIILPVLPIQGGADGPQTAGAV